MGVEEVADQDEFQPICKSIPRYKRIHENNRADKTEGPVERIAAEDDGKAANDHGRGEEPEKESFHGG